MIYVIIPTPVLFYIFIPTPVYELMYWYKLQYDVSIDTYSGVISYIDTYSSES